MIDGIEKPAAIGAPKQSADLRDQALREASRKLEATFLAQMLKSAGLGQTGKAFGGGAGEDQFSSFLLAAQSEEIVEGGGIGLAEMLFKSLKENENGEN